MTISEVFGFTAVVITILCYARLQWQRDFAKTLSYSALNAFASTLMCLSLLENWNAAAFTCNAIWVSISLYGVYRCLKYEWIARRALAAPQ